MFVEQYEYQIRPGMKADWEQFMVERAVPYQTSKGMRILGLSWADGDDTRFVWARAFDSKEERDSLYAAVYESDFWRDELLPEVCRLAVKPVKRTRLDPFGNNHQDRACHQHRVHEIQTGPDEGIAAHV